MLPPKVGCLISMAEGPHRHHEHYQTEQQKNANVDHRWHYPITDGDGGQAGHLRGWQARIAQHDCTNGRHAVGDGIKSCQDSQPYGKGSA